MESLKEYTDSVISVIARHDEPAALEFATSLAERVHRKLGNLSWTAPEVAVARVGRLKLEFFDEFRAYVDANALGPGAMRDLGTLFKG